jgi:hypothetical protein
VLDDRVAHPVAELVRRQLRACHADDGEVLRQQVAIGERVQSGEELALGQVARRTEDRKRARLRRAARAQSFEERVFS